MQVPPGPLDNALAQTESFLHFVRKFQQVPDTPGQVFLRQTAKNMRAIKSQKVERRHLGSKGFGRSHSDFRSGMGVDHSSRHSRQAASHHIHNRPANSPLIPSLLEGRARVRRLARLTHRHKEGTFIK